MLNTVKQGTVKKLEIDNKEIGNSVEVNKKLEKFFESLFKRKQVYNEFLRDISLSTLSQEEKKFLTKELVNKKWFLGWKVLVITNLQETMV